ncbi:MAG: hypothetical protein AAF668_14820 [Pseudomonadota bacterium]
MASREHTGGFLTVLFAVLGFLVLLFGLVVSGLAVFDVLPDVGGATLILPAMSLGVAGILLVSARANAVVTSALAVAGITILAVAAVWRTSSYVVFSGYDVETAAPAERRRPVPRRTTSDSRDRAPQGSVSAPMSIEEAFRESVLQAGLYETGRSELTGPDRMAFSAGSATVLDFRLPVERGPDDEDSGFIAENGLLLTGDGVFVAFEVEENGNYQFEAVEQVFEEYSSSLDLLMELYRTENYDAEGGGCVAEASGNDLFLVRLGQLDDSSDLNPRGWNYLPAGCYLWKITDIGGGGEEAQVRFFGVRNERVVEMGAGPIVLTVEVTRDYPGYWLKLVAADGERLPDCIGMEASSDDGDTVIGVFGGDGLVSIDSNDDSEQGSTDSGLIFDYGAHESRLEKAVFVRVRMGGGPGRVNLKFAPALRDETGTCPSDLQVVFPPSQSVSGEPSELPLRRAGAKPRHRKELNSFGKRPALSTQ